MQKNLSIEMKNHDMRINVLFASIIVILGLGVYADSINGRFVWDDNHLIKDNAYIKDLSRPGAVFITSIKGAAGVKSAFYRPLQMLSYMLDYRAWKLNVVGYHLTNIILHIMVALCIYWLVSILFGDKIMAFLTGAFFAVHPVHTEAVTYISGRADPLAALFMLVSFILYLKCKGIKTVSVFILMVTSYVFALLSRESSLMLPFLLIMYHLVFRRDMKKTEFYSVSLIALIYVLARFTILGAVAPQVTTVSTLFQRIPGFFIAVSKYARLMVLPFDLHMEYGNGTFAFIDPKVLAGAVITIALLSYASARGIKKVSLISFSILWFYIALFPSSNLYPVNAYMAEHWLYLPSVGFFLVIAKAISLAIADKRLKTAGIITAACIIAFYSFLTARQNLHWLEPLKFYERIIKYAPDSARVNNNLAALYHDMGKKDQAILMLKKAIEVDSGYAEPYSNLGLIYHDMGKKGEAIELYKKAIEIAPDYAEAYNNLGLSFSDIGKKAEAMSMFKKAMELNPGYAKPYYNLGNVYHDTGNGAQAIDLYHKAMEIDPSDAKPYYNLANVYQNAGQTKEAISFYEKAITIDPKYARAYNNLGNIYRGMGENELSIRCYENAIRINQNDAFAYNNLGTTYASMGKNKEAISFFEKAIEIMPDHPDLHYNLGNMYNITGAYDKAIASYMRTIEIKPDYANAYNNLAMIYFSRNDYVLAIKYCDKAKEFGLVNTQLLEALKAHREGAGPDNE